MWHHTYSAGAAFYGQVLNGPDAALVGGLRVMSSYYVAYDALDIDYNPPSGEFLLVTHGRNWEDAAVSITNAGDPIDNGFVLTNTTDIRPIKTGDGNFNPRVAASKSEKKWLTVTSSAFAAVSGQFAGSAGTGGGTPGAGPAPATPCPGAGVRTADGDRFSPHRFHGCEHLYRRRLGDRSRLAFGHRSGFGAGVGVSDDRRGPDVRRRRDPGRVTS